MLLSEIFEYLTHGELSQLAVSDQGTEITSEDYAKVASHINLGLLDLHKRFPVKYKELILDTYDSINMYRLSYEYAVSNTASTVPVKYINDASPADTFDPSTLLRVDQVFDEEGTDLPLDNTADSRSLYRPAYNILQVPEPLTGYSLSLIYRVAHPKLIVNAATDVSQVEVDIPYDVLQPLLYFVGARLLNGVGKDSTNAYMMGMQQYEAACQQIEQRKVFDRDEMFNTRLETNGWV